MCIWVFCRLFSRITESVSNAGIRKFESEKAKVPYTSLLVQEGKLPAVCNDWIGIGYATLKHVKDTTVEIEFNVPIQIIISFMAHIHKAS